MIKNGTIIIFMVAVLLLLPFSALAEMTSQDYVIYENVMHSFDGPVISNVHDSVTTQGVTVTWDTDVIADGFVVYDTSNGFPAPEEQGSSVKGGTHHSVTLVGLDSGTTYYFRVRSERVNGGVTTDTTVRQFTTSPSANNNGQQQQQSSTGGGVLIINKTDKVPPVITDITVASATYESVKIDWKTDEPSTSFVQYGGTQQYGTTVGSWATSTDHTVTVNNLIPNSLYHYRVLSSDDWGNLGKSGDRTVATVPGGQPQASTTPPITPAQPNQPNLTAQATQLAIQFINRLFPQVSLNNLTPTNFSNINSLADLSNLIGAPVLSGQPGITLSATQATVSWTTDIAANSQVAFAPADAYHPGASEPYQQIVGNADESTTTHAVTLYNLTPATTYHYQLRSKATIGPTAYSRDFTFQTPSEELKITSYFSQVVDPQTAIFKWVTNKDTDSAIQYAPYHGNTLALDESKTVKDTTQTTIHEIKISDFQGGVIYNVQFISTDSTGNTVTATLDRFSTAANNLPPVISHIKADSTVFLDRSDKIQTIISWLTNEPSTSRVYYEEGVHGGSAQLTGSTDLNDNYTKEHVMVITQFKPGAVYSFRVESIDSSGNTSLSPAHTFMTAKQQQSIIQVILGILEQTFGWMTKLTG